MDEPVRDDDLLETLRSIEAPRLTAGGEVDLSILDYKLSLTPTERLEQNDRFARFLDEIRKARPVR